METLEYPIKMTREDTGPQFSESCLTNLTHKQLGFATELIRKSEAKSISYHVFALTMLEQ